jgi:hypothetical protein
MMKCMTNSLLALITSEGLYVFLSRTDSTSCICVLVYCVTIETWQIRCYPLRFLLYIGTLNWVGCCVSLWELTSLDNSGLWYCEGTPEQYRWAFKLPWSFRPSSSGCICPSLCHFMLKLDQSIWLVATDYWRTSEDPDSFLSIVSFHCPRNCNSLVLFSSWVKFNVQCSYIHPEY